MEKHIVWKQEKRNIGKLQWFIRSMMVCLAYIVFSKGIMGLVGQIFGFQVALQNGGIFLLTLLGVALWNEGYRKRYLPGNILIFGILAVVLWFLYRETAEAIKEGLGILGDTYIDRWNTRTDEYGITDKGNVSALLTVVEFLLLIMVPFLQMLGCKYGKRRCSLVLPIFLVCMGLLVVSRPRWVDIAFLFFSGVLFCYLDSYDTINGKVFGVAAIGALLLLSIAGSFQMKAKKLVFSLNGEWFYLQENLEESIRNGNPFGWFSEEDRVDNRTPIFKEKQVIEVTMSKKPKANVYLRGYHCGDYEEGIWTKDNGAFAEACKEYEIDVEEAARQLLTIQHESEHVNGNEQIIYELKYTGIQDNKLYFPYGAGWDEEPKGYSFPGDFVLNKKKSSKKAEVASWREFRYLDEKPKMGAISDEQGLSMIGIFESGYTSESLSDEERALSDWYNHYVHENYLKVPEYMTIVKRMAEEMKKSWEFSGTIDLIEDPIVGREIRNSSRLQIAQLVSSHLMRGYSYALELDKLLQGEDAVEYFLGTSNKGYCMHFASAGTLILRELGIPSRYVTGYIVKPDTVEYQEGTYKASVLDSDAHSWVEIYMENYGWLPVEMTPGYREGGEEEYRLPEVANTPVPTAQPVVEEIPKESQATPEETKQPIEEKNEQEETKEESSGRDNGGTVSGTGSETIKKKSDSKWVAGSMLLVLVSLVGVIVYRYHVGARKHRLRQLNSYIRRGENQKAVKWINQAVYKILVKSDHKYAKVRDKEYLDALKREFSEINPKSWDIYFEVVQRAVYSREAILAAEVKECYALYRRVQQNSKKSRKKP